jgi:DNA-binding response OmpR family regulator
MTKRILVIDDDRDYAATVARRCRAAGYESAMAVSALEAVEMLGVANYDLIILDVDMPTDGHSVCEFIRSSGQNQQTPIIFLTGHQDRDTICRCVEMGGHYLFKSADVWPRLQHMLDELLQEVAVTP